MNLKLNDIIFDSEGNLHLLEPIFIDIYYIDRHKKYVYYSWDFGMDKEFFLLHPYFEIEKNTIVDLKNIKRKNIKGWVIRQCEIDLIEVFLRERPYPNYSSYQWALKGWYKDKIKIEKL